MNFHDIKKLYLKDDIENCSVALELFLLLNTTHIDALLLKSNIEKEQLFKSTIAKDMELTLPQIQNLMETYHNILNLDPNNTKALYGILEITADFFESFDYIEFDGYCDKLIVTDHLKKEGYAFKFDLNYTFKKFHKCLEILEANYNYQKKIYANNRTILDKLTTSYVLKKAEILRLELSDSEATVRLFENYIDQLVLNNPMLFKNICDLALHHESYELAGKAAIKSMIQIGSDAHILYQNAQDLYDKLKVCINNGIENKNFHFYILLVERNFMREMQLQIPDLLINAKVLITKYPNWFVPYHFAGSCIYDGGNPVEALPYFEKCLEFGGYAITLNRYIDCYVKINHRLPTIDVLPDDNPLDYYNAGVDFDIYEQTLVDFSSESERVEMRIKFYEKSFEGFDRYFNQNFYESNYFISPHIQAMCANNYAVCLNQLGRFNEAINIAAQGIEISEFWEIYTTLGDSYYYSKNFKLALKSYKRAISLGLDEEDFIVKANFESKIIISMMELLDYSNAIKDLKNLEQLLLKYEVKYGTVNRDDSMLKSLKLQLEQAKKMAQSFVN